MKSCAQIVPILAGDLADDLTEMLHLLQISVSGIIEIQENGRGEGGVVPTVEQILLGLKEIANQWRPLAIFWHAYFAALAIILILGIRPSKRLAGLLLALPLLSVSIVAWASSNPFNGMIYALISILR